MEMTMGADDRCTGGWKVLVNLPGVSCIVMVDRTEA
jgi:hypothetical protein